MVISRRRGDPEGNRLPKILHKSSLRNHSRRTGPGHGQSAGWSRGHVKNVGKLLHFRKKSSTGRITVRSAEENIKLLIRSRESAAAAGKNSHFHQIFGTGRTTVVNVRQNANPGNRIRRTMIELCCGDGIVLSTEPSTLLHRNNHHFLRTARVFPFFRRLLPQKNHIYQNYNNRGNQQDFGEIPTGSPV